MQQAIGILETKGLITLVAGTDAMLKSADVKIAAPMKNVGSAIASVTVTGDVAAVKAAIDAGAEAAQQIGEVLSAHVIARPAADLESVIGVQKTTATKRAAASK